MGLSDEIKDCTRCGEAVRNPSPPYGDPNGRMLIVGQSLHGEKNQIPFCCKSGAPLSDGLRRMGLEGLPCPPIGSLPAPPMGYAVTNLVKCFPRRHVVAKEMVKNCLSFLKREVAWMRPRLTVVLGGVAASGIEKIVGVYPRKGEVLQTRGHEVFGTSLIVHVLHPSAAIRSGSGEEWTREFLAVVLPLWVRVN